jgi:TonB family protein
MVGEPERDATIRAASPEAPALFRTVEHGTRARAPFAISSAVHAAALALIVFATVGMGAAAPIATSPLTDTRLVYLVAPGPGGGGGGGGARTSTPPRKARKPGKRAVSSPLPSRPLLAPAPARPEPEPAPQPVEAPVVSVPADDEEQVGVLEDVDAPPDSEGPGADGGAGAGAGAGVGDGAGPGLGEGEGGGTGGGPYRPGSGIDPPTVVREVKPLYTEAARHRGIQGDVLLEIVVRRDGSVGDVRVLQGLGDGLDARAIDAVRQWQFRPARRFGTPVDVLVEVAMEFRLR